MESRPSWARELKLPRLSNGNGEGLSRPSWARELKRLPQPHRPQ